MVKRRKPRAARPWAIENLVKLHPRLAGNPKIPDGSVGVPMN